MCNKRPCESSRELLEKAVACCVGKQYKPGAQAAMRDSEQHWKAQASGRKKMTLGLDRDSEQLLITCTDLQSHVKAHAYSLLRLSDSVREIEKGR